MFGFLSSSVRYSNRREGSARNSKIMAGRIVHTVSMYWASNRYRLDNLFIIIIISAYVTTVITSERTIRVLSWKEISCSIIGDAASWRSN
jgi:hypothetical protein